ncbi:MAG: FAD-dependent oxidoreductase [Deltaproteobacteria bacterium]|nr:FAD-dependent oxidoreductase [Deltaproteobacteria bacterium]MBW2392786.1 FAD-dependent oxidoreductase [Deltaproteobacteria bacterium]
MGGGIASLSAAYQLTNRPGWKKDYDLTLYQLGWRVGGKGASGRNREHNDRIEEHGLHVWFGCYDESFKMLRTSYEELARSPGCPIRSVEEAFDGVDTTPYMEHIGDQWLHWPVEFPPNALTPGEGPGNLSAWQHVLQLIHWVELAFETGFERSPASSTAVHHVPDWLEKIVPSPETEPSRYGSHRYLSRLTRLVHELPEDAHAHLPHHHHGILWLTDQVRGWFHRETRDLLTKDDDLRRIAIGIDLAITIARGFVADGVLIHGYKAIDGEDTRAWLERHGAHDFSVWSAPIRALYDLCFAYVDGDLDQPNFSAGSSLHVVMRIAFEYKGHVVYEMNAGMGDVVIAPIYQALAKRGVKFEYFRRVEKLELSADKKSIECVRIARQVDLLGDTYEPLHDFQGLPCFPSTPLVEQIRDGSKLKGINLESKWSGWTDVGRADIHAGVDFDEIVLGISLAGLETICEDLRCDSDWVALLDGMGTVQTAGVQLWMSRGLTELGWTQPPLPIDAGPEPLDVWADRSAIMHFENWPPIHGPKSLQYLCGPLPGSFYEQPSSDLEVPEIAQEEVDQLTTRWLEEQSQVLWPTLTGENGFDWDSLYAPGLTTDGDRLGAQYVRANIDPSERYVMSLAGTGHLRFKQGQTGFKNLVVTGDWTHTSWNAGCIESAVLSGIHAAEAIAKKTGHGEPERGFFAKLLHRLWKIVRGLF